MRLLSVTAILSLVFATTPSAVATEAVTIYRCVGNGGKLTLRDSPCEKGESQQVRSMQRPKDPPPATRPIVRVETPARSPSANPPVVIYRTPPQPMFECTDPDGKRYTADNGEGNPRWVPLWTLGYPVAARATVVRPPGGELRVERGRVTGGIRSGEVKHVVVPTYAGYGGGTWVRDTCQQLPPQEVCARLSDRRYAIQRRYHSALQSERHALDLEQRGIDARLANDCGN